MVVKQLAHGCLVNLDGGIFAQPPPFLAVIDFSAGDLAAEDIHDLVQMVERFACG